MCVRFVKYKLPSKDDVDIVKDVGTAYSEASMVRGITITFRIGCNEYQDFLNLMVGWELFLVLPSAIDRAQFNLGTQL